MQKDKLLFLDMDGVLADFERGLQNSGGDLQSMFNNGFFQTLEPMESGLCDTIKKLQQEVKIKILSKACVDRRDIRFQGQVLDKINWIKRFIPSIEVKDIIIQSSDESKGQILNEFKGNTCILLDDYSFNLTEWVLNGGIGIKKCKRIKERPFKQVLKVKDLVGELENIF